MRKLSKTIVGFVLALSIVSNMRIQTEAASFQDVNQGDWYYNPVTWISERHVMNGLNTIRFGPGENLARAQLAVVLYRMVGEEASAGGKDFPDVPRDIWYGKAVRWASAKGIVSGYSHNGHYGSNDNITREQLAAMLYRFAGYKELDISIRGSTDAFSDADRVSNYAKDAISWTIGTGIIKGKKDRIDPGGNANRAEIAQMVHNFVHYYQGSFALKTWVNYKEVHHEAKGHYETVITEPERWKTEIKSSWLRCRSCGYATEKIEADDPDRENKAQASTEEISEHCFESIRDDDSNTYCAATEVLYDYKRVYYPAVTKQVWVEDQKAWTEKVPVPGYWK